MRIYLFKSLVFNCRKATLLALKKEDGHASVLEHIQLYYHSFYCRACRQYLKQSTVINTLLGIADQHQFENPAYHLPDQVKEHFQEQINQFKK